jgi:hypothetical protein
MTFPYSSFSFETLTLPHEDPAENRRLVNQWLTAYPCFSPIARGFLEQAVGARVEKRRLERVRATLRAERLRTAVLYFDRQQEDNVARCLLMFNESCEDGMRHLTRSAAGCRWAIAKWERLQKQLAEEGTWHFVHMIGAIQLQGVSACLDQLFFSEDAFMTWLDCLVAQPNAKQKDIDQLITNMNIQKLI